MSMATRRPVYSRIYTMVQQIPPGKVATYGQIASLVGRCTARMVGYAMAATPANLDVPWQRVINAQGKVSPRADNGGAIRQRILLEEEGVVFDEQNRVDLQHYQWTGPPLEWMLANDYDPAPSWRER